MLQLNFEKNSTEAIATTIIIKNNIGITDECSDLYTTLAVGCPTKRTITNKNTAANELKSLMNIQDLLSEQFII